MYWWLSSLSSLLSSLAVITISRLVTLVGLEGRGGCQPSLSLPRYSYTAEISSKLPVSVSQSVWSIIVLVCLSGCLTGQASRTDEMMEKYCVILNISYLYEAGANLLSSTVIAPCSTCDSHLVFQSYQHSCRGKEPSGLQSIVDCSDQSMSESLSL